MTETKRDLAADLAVCDAATAGPWDTRALTKGYVVAADRDFGVVASVIEYNVDGSEYMRLGGESCESNRKFIAEARTGWPHAIKRAIAAEESAFNFDAQRYNAEAEVTRLEMEVERLMTLLDDILDDHECALSTRELIEEALDGDEDEDDELPFYMDENCDLRRKGSAI